MEYKMEDLLPIVMELSEKYTSKESSSITYETAQMLMEGVIYCMDEAATSTTYAASANNEDISVVYKEGYNRILKKVEEARNIYNQLVETFDDYGCNNYRNTILKEIPSFFLNYRPKFEPQNHKIQLDYPCFHTLNLNGIHLILEYLKRIRLENYFLSYFDRNTIIHLLEQTTETYTSFYFENIPYLVLFHAVGCKLSGKSPYALLLDREDCKIIEENFLADTCSEIQQKVKEAIKDIMKDMELELAESYFMMVSNDYSSRIERGIQYHTIPILFFCQQ